MLYADNDLVDDFKMNIFPNPTRDNLNLSFNTINSNNYQWIIFNEIGAKVSQSKANNYFSTAVNEQISVGDLKSGLYFISLIIEGNVITKEFIVN